MKQVVSQRLYEYWNRLRQGRPAPDRNEIEPSDIRNILGDTFILQADRDFRFRLAGTRICSIYCRELKGRNFLSMWNESDREALESLLTAVREDAAAAVVGVAGRTERGQDLDMEIVLLPLSQKGDGFTRILGACVPANAPYWIGTHPVMKQRVSSLRMIWPDETPFFLRNAADADAAVTPIIPGIAANDTGSVQRRQVRHLTVYDGGRS